MADLNISRGGDAKATFWWKVKDTGDVIDITGYTACLNIRPGVDSSVILHQATDGDGLTITGGEGKIVLDIPAAVTKDFKFVDAVTDLKLIDPSGNIVYFPIFTVNLKGTVSREC